MTSNSATSTKKWPLEGIKVLDLGQIYNGPYAGFLLAHAGADVVKVEPLSGEVLRERGPDLREDVGEVLALQNLPRCRASPGRFSNSIRIWQILAESDLSNNIF